MNKETDPFESRSLYANLVESSQESVMGDSVEGLLV